MKILGLDPGIATTGFGLIAIENNSTPHLLDYGIIQTDKDLTIGDRLAVLYTDVQALLAQTQPGMVSMEKLFFYRMGNLIPIAQARGVILLALAQRGITPQEYSPPQVKLALTGAGQASKTEVQAAVVRELHLDRIPRPDDCADALAIALTCYFNNQHIFAA
ncbi:MAG: crossover junction endodeoxyribonuclease RuvC [Pseudanabaenaceae cyanobacterium SKYGB_i_bin29]|nr:crossover junction endodeoxyribonuclease RuvC [Pseudanabaenaceae cyanobacterium SKYG29]MDW8420552.1 crossover junction endodeoxyribonuclease RuvC [Pseudanabaenaceae cyanobacterium SKYGB_i_bin29]